jgi:SAM-dependent methyltransferase
MLFVIHPLLPDSCFPLYEGKMALIPHSAAWYDRLASMQKGYFYNWHSHIDPWHGEDFFRILLDKHLRPSMDVLEIACAQGELTLSIAASCRSVAGYDRTGEYIHLAQKTAQERGITNATFIQHDSSPEVNGGRAHMPVPDQTVDFLVCSKGPFHWIEDARRVGRPGAVLLMLVPDATPLTPWTTLLPEPLRWQESDPDWAKPAIEHRLAAVQLKVHSWWNFDVPEIFPSPQDLYAWRTWGNTPDEVPSYAEIAPGLERIFQQYGNPNGLEIRRRRYIWKAVIP